MLDTHLMKYYSDVVAGPYPGGLGIVGPNTYGEVRLTVPKPDLWLGTETSVQVTLN